MGRKPSGEPVGRPPREFDKLMFEELCTINCTVNEIESILRTDQRTLDKWCKETYDGEDFSTIYKVFCEKGRSSVRRAQIRMAETNASMGIWLGKVLLKQKEPLQDLIENGDLAKLLTSNQTLMDQITKAQEQNKLHQALNAARSDSRTDNKSELETG